MWIKICGLTDETGVAAALEARADAIGFVFFPPSPRSVTFERAAELAGPARGKAEIISLTVNAENGFLDDLVEAVHPDILQFHGQETPEQVRAAKDRFGLPVMKALPVGSAEDLATISTYRGVADRILLDAKPPEDATRPGGNGEAFDWTLLAALDADLPYVLSGGLNEHNVAEALAVAHAAGRPPWGVDVSSGVEDAPGLKNSAAVWRFAATVRAASAPATGAIAAVPTV